MERAREGAPASSPLALSAVPPLALFTGRRVRQPLRARFLICNVDDSQRSPSIYSRWQHQAFFPAWSYCLLPPTVWGGLDCHSINTGAEAQREEGVWPSSHGPGQTLKPLGDAGSPSIQGRLCKHEMDKQTPCTWNVIKSCTHAAVITMLTNGPYRVLMKIK